jgi:hypothetical protein
MYQDNNFGQQIIYDVESIEQKRDKIEFNKNNSKKSVNGRIVNVTDSKVISITNYYGNGVDRIDATSDVRNMGSNKLDILCSSAQNIGNRVILDFDDGRHIEISGNLKAAEI